MIGLAFAVHETFGTSEGVEDDAFAHALEGYLRSAALPFDVQAAAAFGTLRRPTRTALRDAFAAALRPHVPSDRDLDALAARFYGEAAARARRRFEPFADVAPTLRELEALGIPLAALGRGSASVDAELARAAGFTGPLVSPEDLGVDPASPVVFARLTEALHVPAECVWFVASDPGGEIAAAAGVGMRTIRIDRRDAPAEAGVRRPDAIVASFAELLDIVAEPYTRGLLALREIVGTAFEWQLKHIARADTPPD